MKAARQDRPPLLQVVLAFATAPAVAALAFSCVSPFYAGLTNIFERIARTFPFVLIIGGYLPTLALGVPAFIVLRRWLRPSLTTCIGIGASIAALPWLLLALLPTGAASASVDGVATVVDGHITLAGLWIVVVSSAGIALFGALGGLTFWLVATWQKGKLPGEAPSTTKS